MEPTRIQILNNDYILSTIVYLVDKALPREDTMVELYTADYASLLNVSVEVDPSFTAGSYLLCCIHPDINTPTDKRYVIIPSFHKYFHVLHKLLQEANEHRLLLKEFSNTAVTYVYSMYTHASYAATCKELQLTNKQISIRYLPMLGMYLDLDKLTVSNTNNAILYPADTYDDSFYVLTYTEYGYMLFTYKDKTIKIYKNSINGYKVYKAFDNLLKGYVIDFGIQGDDSYISISLPEPDTSMKIPLSAVTITLTDNCCIRLSWLGFVILVDPAAAYVNVNVAVSNRKLKCNTLLNRRTTNSSELLRALVNYVDKRRLS